MPHYPTDALPIEGSALVEGFLPLIALTPGGRLVYTVEQADPARWEDYRLTPQGRYVHRRDYLQRIMDRAGLAIVTLEPLRLRRQGDNRVEGWLVTGRLEETFDA